MNIKHKLIQFTLLFVQFNVKYLRYYNVFVMLSHLKMHKGQIVMPFQVTDIYAELSSHVDVESINHRFGHVNV